MLRWERQSLPLVDWGRVLEGCEDRTIFQTPAWLSFISSTQRAEPVLAVLTDGRSTLGYFSGVMIRRFGLRILGSPLPGSTTSYMGFNLVAGMISRKDAVAALFRFAFDDLRCVHVEILDRHLTVEEAHDLKVPYRAYRGFEVDLRPNEETLFARMDPSCRRCIRRAGRSGVTIEEVTDVGFADDYYSQLREVFGRQGLVPTYGVERVRALVASLRDTGRLLLLRARDSDGRSIATGIFPADDERMYFWGGASRREALHLRPNEAIQWHAVRYWKRRGVRAYDMGGAGAYKKKYGGSEIQVPWLRQSKYRWIEGMRETVKCMVAWRQRCLGTSARLAQRLHS